MIHLCGAASAKDFARRGFRLIAGERCGDHDVATYVPGECDEAGVPALRRRDIEFAKHSVSGRVANHRNVRVLAPFARMQSSSEGSLPFRPARSGRESILGLRALRAARTCGGGERGNAGESSQASPFTPRTPNTSQEGRTVRIPLAPAERRANFCTEPDVSGSAEGSTELTVRGARRASRECHARPIALRDVVGPPGPR